MSDQEQFVATGAGDQPAPTPEDAVRPADAERATGASDPATAEPGSDEVARARSEAASYLDDLRRLKAEFENYRKRVVREQTALIESATVALVERLLPVLDDFELALIAADRTKDYEALVRGVELVFSKLREVLDKEGLRKIEAQGESFDPELHEAVMEEEGAGGEKPVVTEVFRTGYTLGGRVIRPAMVKVRKE